MIEGRRIFMNMNDVCIYAYFMISMTGNVLAAEYGQLILGLVVVAASRIDNNRNTSYLSIRT